MVRVLPQVSKLGEMALNLLFPQWCIGCGKEGSFICVSCRRSLSVIMPPVCPLCGRPQLNGMLCSQCVSWKVDIDGIRSPYRFEGVIQQAVYQLKYRNLRASASLLAEMMNEYLAANPVPGDVLVPVPLHKKRVRERGYNQSGLLARKLGKLRNMPVIENCLMRLVNTPPQARTGNLEERKMNVSGAFSCRDNRLKGKRVILVDDVSTSGSTLDACAAVLKETGVESVWGLVLAREI